jgi:hypothetical protein
MINFKKLILCCLLLSATIATNAATWVVLNGDNSSTGSLRDIIGRANDGDIITFGPSVKTNGGGAISSKVGRLNLDDCAFDSPFVDDNAEIKTEADLVNDIVWSVERQVWGIALSSAMNCLNSTENQT